MKLTLVLVTVTLTITLLAEAYPQSTSISHRSKRGFKANSASRVAHGYGKRGFPSWKNYFRDGGSDVLSVEDMAELVAENPSLAKALLRKFVDTDNDGIISTTELLGTKQLIK